MNTRDLLAKFLKLSCVVCVGYVVAAPSQAFAVTKRTAQVNVQNNSGRDIEIITVSHKYSDNYKNSETWLNLPNGAKTKAPLVVEYNTGFGTTGRDWWRISWKFKGDPGLYVTNPNNFRREIDALESIGPGVLVAAGTALGSLAGGATGGAAGTYLAPGVGTTYGAAAGKAVGGKAGAAAAKAMADALMNGESTVGFKQHILRSDDESGNTPTIIEIKADGVTFRSPSGNSDTVYVKSGDVPEPPTSPAQPAQVGESYSKQGGGAFSKGDGNAWVETAADPNWQLHFVESGRDKDWIRLFDSTRNMTVSLPVGGGMSQWSTDGGKTWNNLVRVDRAQ